MTFSATQGALHIRVPASTSNLGPGYDVLGCAFQLHNEFLVRLLEGEGDSEIAFTGPQAKGLTPSPDNVFFTSAARLFQFLGRPVPRLEVTAVCHVPNARGLGSSSTAVVAGLLAADAICGGMLEDGGQSFFAAAPVGVSGLLDLASQIEGHPDNVAPALLGGLTCAMMAPDGHVVASRSRPHPALGFVVYSPDYEVRTEDARNALPKTIAHSDAVANLARLPLLIDALTRGDASELALLTIDRLHEPYRKPLYRQFEELKAVAREAGAAAACLSGAGPSMLAIGVVEDLPRVAQAWKKAAEDFGLGGEVRVLEVEYEGASVQSYESAPS
ncbi:MAG: homoserine kinase [Sumerlaeia bacterium]